MLLGGLATKVCSLGGPRIAVDPASIRILSSPQEYYSAILDHIQAAERRLFVSSLYIGTSEPELELVRRLEERMVTAPTLQVSILLDRHRGQRKEASSKRSSVDVLQGLVTKYPSRLSVSLYSSLNLRGVKQLVMPPRWNELFGVQHTKVVVSDSSVILSGANLSKDYFTARQDRYFLFHKEEALAEWEAQLHSAICSLSYRLGGDGSLCPATIDPVRAPKSLLKTKAQLAFHALLSPQWTAPSMSSTTGTATAVTAGATPSPCAKGPTVSTTFVVPTIQAGAVAVVHDEAVTEALLSFSHSGASLSMCLAYMNLTRKFQAALLGSQSRVRILMAGPKANGFYTAKDFLKHIPEGYTWAQERFFRALARAGHSNRVHLWEYDRSGWVFHGKGIWLDSQSREDSSSASASASASATGSDAGREGGGGGGGNGGTGGRQDGEPTMVTMIGSPNYGERSVQRDLESSLVLFTSDERLCNELRKERDCMFKYGSPVTAHTFEQSERKVSWWIPFVTPVVKSYL